MLPTCPARPSGKVVDASKTFDPLTHSAQWSRRFIGLKLFMALAERGEAGFAEKIEHQTSIGACAAEVFSGERVEHC